MATGGPVGAERGPLAGVLDALPTPARTARADGRFRDFPARVAPVHDTEGRDEDRRA